MYRSDYSQYIFLKLPEIYKYKYKYACQLIRIEINENKMF